MNNSQTYINYFAQTDFRGKKVPFGIKAEDRARHVYIIGKTGMGKSTTLENMAIQDIKNGEGLAFCDPHGNSAELLLDYVPKERIKDVIYFAPFDLDYPIAFNVMEDVGRDQRHLVANGLMSAFKKIWVDAWSARMEYILNNILLALLEYPGSTLLGVNRMISDKEYRKKVVDNITDPSVKSFWVDEFANYTERFAAEATPAIQNKIGQFTSNPLIRNIIGQPKSTIDFRKIMDEKKILIVNLSKGRLGEDNAKLIGAMLITKIYLAAMSRANVPEQKMKLLPSFYLFVDEFQSFVNDSFADILSEARKYKLSLTVAHQYIEQMPENVRNAVFGNVGTTVSFRVGPFDAELLEKIFTPAFTQEDLVNLGFAQIYLTLMIDGVGSPPFSASTLPRIVSLEESHKEEIIEYSRQHYGAPRSSVEGGIINWIGEDKKAPVSKPESSKANGSKPNLPERRQVNMAVPIERRKNFQPTNDHKRPEARPVPVATASDQKPVSLNTLKSNVKDSGKHKDALRSALQSLLRSQTPEAKEEDKGSAVGRNDAEKKHSPKTQPADNLAEARQEVKKAPIDKQPEAPKSNPKGEIPEAELRRMLDVPLEDK